MEFLIVSGLSGAGKSTVMSILEDSGFFCVDNLPPVLIPKFAEVCMAGAGTYERVAMVCDIRGGENFDGLFEAMEALKAMVFQYKVLFVEAEDAVIIKRYKETRRVHPLAMDGRVEDGVKAERKVMENIRRSADYVIDTTNLLTRELKEELDRIFVENAEYNSLMVTVMSFGFKHGIPADADIVMDVRFLPNPFYIEELKRKTGNDREVQEYAMGFSEAQEFPDRFADMLQFLIPNYVKEGKYRLVVAIGCTGGRHRSVTLANELYGRMKNKGKYGLKLYHRDVSSQAG